MLLNAIDICGITPAEFDALDTSEYDALLEAGLRREQRNRRFAAGMTANLMNCLAKKRDRKLFTADDLLGTGPKKKKAARGVAFADADPEAKGRMLANLTERIEKKRGKQATSTA
jgi:hypothetical protein